jgi:hypothetical protein
MNEKEKGRVTRFFPPCSQKGVGYIGDGKIENAEGEKGGR